MFSGARALGILVVALSVAACATTGPLQPTNAQIFQAALTNILSSGEARLLGGSPLRLKQVLEFYEQRDFQPAWTGGTAEENMAAEARAILVRAREHGLHNEDYAIILGDRPAPGGEAAQYELALTDAVIRYSHEVRSGRFRPGDIYRDVGLASATEDTVGSLVRAVEARRLVQFLEQRPPSHPEYSRLAKALANYRAIADQGEWPMLPGRNEIRLENRDPRIATLATRLAFEDPVLAGIANPAVADLREAVRRFQARSGLAPDGRVGPRTIEMLNVPALYRASQIAANMERWRWMPERFERRHIAVNVPDQSLEYVRDGDVILTSPVIVGRKSSPTPILRSAIRTVVANPPWNIPGDIAARDLLPQLRRNPNYLATKNMVVMDGPEGDPHGRTIAWRNVIPAEFPYHIRELPGTATSLGEIMLDSPNEFDVYLHDTPNKKLYESLDREISNGCVRVQNIFALASLVLTDSPNAAIGNLTAISKSNETQRLALNEPLPVYFLYWTALADDKGIVGFRPDRYGRDAPLIAALTKSGSVAAGDNHISTAPAEGEEELSP